MKDLFTLRIRYLLAALLGFGVLVAIALWVRDSFVRPFLGDVLAVIWLYTLCRAFIARSSTCLATLVLGFACLLELGQYLNLLDLLGLQDVRLARVVLGATFDPLDLLAYLIGWTVVMGVERWRARVDNSPS